MSRVVRQWRACWIRRVTIGLVVGSFPAFRSAEVFDVEPTKFPWSTGVSGDPDKFGWVSCKVWHGGFFLGRRHVCDYDLLPYLKWPLSEGFLAADEAFAYSDWTVVKEVGFQVKGEFFVQENWAESCQGRLLHLWSVQFWRVDVFRLVF